MFYSKSDFSPAEGKLRCIHCCIEYIHIYPIICRRTAGGGFSGVSYYRIKRYGFQFESKLFIECTMKEIWLGRFGTESNVIPACSGVRSPFSLLHFMHAAIMFSQVSGPP